MTAPVVGNPQMVERALLGMCLVQPGAIDQADLSPDQFQDYRHKQIWRLMQELRESGSLKEESLPLYQAIIDKRMTSSVGGMEYVLGLGDNAPTAASVGWYANYIREACEKKDMVRIFGDLRTRAEAGEDPSMLRERLETHVKAIEGSRDATVHQSSELVPDLRARMLREYNGESSRYLMTGIREWDKNDDWLGIRSEGITLFLGRSGMGKTTVINSLALNMANTGFGVYLHGTETSTLDRIETMVFSLAGVDSKLWSAMCRWKANYGLTGDSEVSMRRMNRKLEQAMRKIQRLPMRTSGSGKTVEQIAAKARWLRRMGSLDVMFVDYLQDFEHSAAATGIKIGDQVSQTRYVSRSLKDLSAELGVPIVIGAQVSGEKQTSTERVRPQMHDVQWSSGAHQDAEEVYAVNRGDYWVSRLGNEYNPSKHGVAGTVEIIARKRRVGTLGRLEIPFDGPTKWIGERWDLAEDA